MDNDFLSVFNEQLDEMPPPYTEIDETQQLLFEDILPVLYPTDMTIAAAGEMTTAQQLLRPRGHSLGLQLEGIYQTTVHVYPDNEDRYRGLISVQAKFYHYREPSDNHENDQMPPAILCETTADEKTNRMQHIFRPSNALEKICCIFKVVLPLTAIIATATAAAAADVVLPELLLRLPRNSQLIVQNIKQGTVGLLDTAIIQGTVEMQGVHVDKLRLVVGNGSINSVDVSVQTAAKFVVISGDIHLRQCNARKNIIIRAQKARISMQAVSSQKMDIHGGTRPINADSTQAEIIHIHSDSGHVFIDCSAKELVIKSNSGPVRGTWNVEQLLDINAVSAIVRGSIEFSGDSARARVRARGWPVSLAVSKEYLGHYNIRAINSVVNFGLPLGTRYENHSHWCQGVIGIAANVLDVENVSAPIVISAT
ncbi:hypothetical protein J3B02_005360 [Coemansia erecta]|uniref:Adhesin domain-containing protein n=1 Tax=Coemansia asiatica TaxID=1052880 RepID=A0A9W7XLU7_9FUNG|nr:hypothetical protein LPJ64_002907 [Coemansia asiatica]KAJ2843141.1 hypothetical protein J3B02_005360 [Coemansia erecta]